MASRYILRAPTAAPLAAVFLGAVMLLGPSWAPHMRAAQTQQRSVVALVVDSDGAPAPQLQPDDVTVREDGVRREVIRVTPAPPPRAVALLIDDSEASRPVLRELREALTRFADMLADLTPMPAVRVTTFGDRPTVVTDFIASFPAVSHAIDRIVPRTGGGSTFLEAVVETARDLSDRDLSQAVIVAFVAETGPELSSLRHTDVSAALERAGASLWTITLTSPAADEMAEGNRERTIVLDQVTEQTGGRNRIILSGQDLPRAFQALFHTLGSRYEITYGRPERLIPPSRIDVSVRQPNLRVFTPRRAAP